MPKIIDLTDDNTPALSDKIILSDGSPGGTRRSEVEEVLALGTPMLRPDTDGKAHVDAPVTKDDVPGIQLDTDVDVTNTVNATPVIVLTTTLTNAKCYALRALVTVVNSTGSLAAEFVVEAGYNVTGSAITERHKTITEKGSASGYALDINVNGLNLEWEATGDGSTLTWSIHWHLHTGIPV